MNVKQTLDVIINPDAAHLTINVGGGLNEHFAH